MRPAYEARAITYNEQVRCALVLHVGSDARDPPKSNATGLDFDEFELGTSHRRVVPYVQVARLRLYVASLARSTYAYWTWTTAHVLPVCVRCSVTVEWGRRTSL